MEKWADVDFDRCRPSRCQGGRCRATHACTHRLLEQEESFEPPMLLSMKMCVGCGFCVKACPLGAIQVRRG